MQQTSRSSVLSGAIAALGTQWEAFQAHGAILDGVRPEIAASWRRTAGHALRCELPAAPVDEAALRGCDQAGHARRQFPRAARGLADGLAEELRDTSSAVIVCDDFGVVLYRTGAPAILSGAERVNLVPGAVWSEREAGTNGVGLALQLGTLAHVYASEHYVGAFHGFSCTAAPVHHPVTREVLGVLGLAADTSVTGALATALVGRAADQIERRLEQELFGRERELFERHLRGRRDHPAPFLTVDRSGQMVIQSTRMLQTLSGEDIQLLLGIARQALTSDADASEQLELSRGCCRADVELVRGESEVLGALVSVQRPARERPHPGAPAPEAWGPLIGRSPAMQRLFREATKVARERIRVAVWGEPGTGKLTLAERLHQVGGDHGPLTIVHCARDGWSAEWRRVCSAGGTIVLSRIHALGPRAQLELADELDALAGLPDPPWVISLINSGAPAPGPELRYRLAPVSLTVPALRDRGHDLRLLIDAWCERRERSDGTRPVVRPEGHEALAARAWPGNVRELHNVLDAAVLRGGSVIGADSLAREDLAAAPARAVSGSLREIEHAAIDGALARNGGNVSRAARELGIGRATLHRRLRAYRLMTPPPEEAGLRT